MIAIASCWPPSVAAGSGTTVSQQRLLAALHLAGVEAELLYTSRFATSTAELEDRRRANAELNLDSYEAGLGIDGEGWIWAPNRRSPFVALCEAVLVEVLPFEDPQSAELLRIQADWEAAAARQADAVIARSAFAAARVAEAYGVQPARITTLPIPFDVDGWRKALPSIHKEPLVLAAGHLYPRKNYRVLLEAWPFVLAAHRDARLVIVGAGPEQAPLAAAAHGLPSVVLAGHVTLEQLLGLYARASVFCHPSLQENFGIAVVEGLASDANLVLQDHPATLETAGGLPGVWAIDARQPPALGAALIEALDAPLPSAARLDGLRSRLDPLSIGKRLKSLIDSVQ